VSSVGVPAAHAQELHLGAEMNAAIMALQAAQSIYGVLAGNGSR